VRLDQIINMRHELVQLAGKIDWEFIDREIAPLYRDSGRPADEGFARRGCRSAHLVYPMLSPPLGSTTKVALH
jgi:hypothetical protein